MGSLPPLTDPRLAQIKAPIAASQPLHPQHPQLSAAFDIDGEDVLETLNQRELRLRSPTLSIYSIYLATRPRSTNCPPWRLRTRT